MFVLRERQFSMCTVTFIGLYLADNVLGHHWGLNITTGKGYSKCAPGDDDIIYIIRVDVNLIYIVYFRVCAFVFCMCGIEESLLPMGIEAICHLMYTEPGLATRSFDSLRLIIHCQGLLLLLSHEC